MASVWDAFSQTTLQVSGRCHLTCLHCPLWKEDPQTALQIDKRVANLVKKDQLFKEIPKKKWINLIGGDPFKQPFLPKILDYIQKKGCKTRLWTHGFVSLDMWDQVRDVVDEVMLYCPSYEADSFREWTGVEGWQRWQHSLADLKAHHMAVTLHHAVRPDNIEWMPEIYEIAYQHDCPLIFHYDPKAGFTGDSLAFIKRYRRVKGVKVFRTGQVSKTACAAYCPQVVVDPWQWVTSWG